MEHLCGRSLGTAATSESAARQGAAVKLKLGSWFFFGIIMASSAHGSHIDPTQSLRSAVMLRAQPCSRRQSPSSFEAPAVGYSVYDSIYYDLTVANEIKPETM